MLTTDNLGVTLLETNTGTQIPRTNQAFEDFDKAISGLAEIDLTVGNATLTRDEYLCSLIFCAGAPDGAREILLPDNISGRWIVHNFVGQTVTFKTSMAPGVAVPSPSTYLIVSNGEAVVAVDAPPGAVVSHSHSGASSDGGALGLPLFTVQGGDPSSPTAGYFKVYAKAGGIYAIDSAGTITQLGGGSGTASLNEKTMLFTQVYS